MIPSASAASASAADGLTPMVPADPAWYAVSGGAPILDGHNDLPWALRLRDGELASLPYDDLGSLEGFSTPLQCDFRRFRAGRVGAQVWVIFLHPPKPGENILRPLIDSFDRVHRFFEATRHRQRFCATPAAVRAAWGAGLFAGLLALEGGHLIDQSLATLRMGRRLGAAYLTMTHMGHSEWADSATAPPQFKGLTEFGRSVVREMNRIGLLADLSHTSPDTMRQTLDLAKAPVLFSHSGAIAACTHPRNVPDDVLARVKTNGGLVMATFVPEYLRRDVWEHEAAVRGELERLKKLEPTRTDAELKPLARRKLGPMPACTVADIADHIDRLRDALGVSGVGVGSDFEGFGMPGPTGIEDVGGMPRLFEELERRGYSKEDRALIASGNFLRVWQAALDAADPEWRA